MNESLAKKNTEYCQKTVFFKGEIEKTFLILGQRLMKIRDENLFEPNYETFEEFCREMKMSLATVSKLINIYQRFIVEWNFAPLKLAAAGGWTVVAELLPVVQNKKEAAYWLDIAEHNSRADLRRELNEKQTGITEENCRHKNKYSIEICRDCKGRRVIDDSAKPKDGKK